MSTHRVRVGPLPAWLDRARLVGPGAWAWSDETGEASLSTREAADLAARLRGLTLAGHAVTVDVQPPLRRPAVRAARTEEARRMRATTPGFTHPGARLDEEGRRFLTPEALALELGRRADALLGPDRLVLDATCGCGGNALGFARAGLRVLACELDPERAALARHNARTYGVAERVEVLTADARTLVASTPADLVFVDVPWGSHRDLGRLTADDLPLLGELLARVPPTTPCWLKLPAGFDPSTLPGFVPEAIFGEADGDRRRVKLLLLRRD
ncbi:MAG: methyltransferase domain-containing protein [Alphaproteobacteria bacterium]|nr:methyltransferase domain-containing protein [Alphaproteobacteria bacterium]